MKRQLIRLGRQCGSFSLCIVVAGVAVAPSQSAPAVNLKGSLVLLDTTPDTTPVSALGVAIYSPTTFAMYRAQPDQFGHFELKGVRFGHYRLEIGMPSRLKTFEIRGRDVSPSDFQVGPDTAGPMRIALSMAVGELTVKAQGGVDVPLTAVLAPDDEFLTLHSQFNRPVASGVAEFRFLPPGRYLIFVVDSDLSRDVGTDARLRAALKQEGTAVEVVSNKNTNTTARYISRQTVEDCIRQTVIPDSHGGKGAGHQ